VTGGEVARFLPTNEANWREWGDSRRKSLVLLFYDTVQLFGGGEGSWVVGGEGGKPILERAFVEQAMLE